MAGNKTERYPQDEIQRAYLPNAKELRILIGQDDVACLNYLWHKLYGPGKVVCPNCNKLSHFSCRFSGDAAFRCNHPYCKYEINPLKGTIFGHTHVKLLIWFKMLYALRTRAYRTSISSLSKELGISEPTAGKMRRALLKELEREKELG